MTFEVENKYRAPDTAELLRRIRSLGAVAGETVRQMDQYFNHPSRDFAQTDEALRVRRVGEKSCCTFKGPKLDSATKTRHEIEIPFLSTADADQFAEMLTRLGFRPVATVSKQRAGYKLSRNDRLFEIVIDQVDQLGSFVEIETLAEEPDLKNAQAALTRLAAELGLSNPERQSYLELLLIAQRDS